jgi:hypothetical protein
MLACAISAWTLWKGVDFASSAGTSGDGPALFDGRWMKQIEADAALSQSVGWSGTSNRPAVNSMEVSRLAADRRKQMLATISIRL